MTIEEITKCFEVELKKARDKLEEHEIRNKYCALILAKELGLEEREIKMVCDIGDGCWCDQASRGDCPNHY